MRYLILAAAIVIMLAGCSAESTIDSVTTIQEEYYGN